MPYLFDLLKNPQNLSITLRRGSTSGFLSSSIFLYCPKPPPPEPPLPKPPPLSDFLLLTSVCSSSSTQAGVVVIHSTLSTRLCRSPNSASAPVSTSSSDMLFHEFSNTSTLFCILSTILVQKRRCPLKALSYLFLNWSM